MTMSDKKEIKNIILIGGNITEVSKSVYNTCLINNYNLIFIPAFGNSFLDFLNQSEKQVDVEILEDLSEDGVSGCIEKIRARHSKAYAVIFDFTIVNYCKRCNILEDFWIERLRYSLKLLFSFSKRIVGFMTPQKEGKIVCVTESLVKSESILPLFIEYNTLVASIKGFTRSLAKELCYYKINVNSIHSGISETSARHILPEPFDAEIIKNELSLNRFINQTEITQALEYASGEASTYMQGIEWKIEGGMHLF